MVGKYFGFPGPSEDAMARWSRATQDDIFYNLTRDPKKHDAAIAAGKEMAAYLPKLFAKRRKAKNLPQSKDAVSRLLATHFVGTIGWDDQRMMSNVMGLLVGAVETNNAAIAQAVDEFLKRPDILAKAQAAAAANDDASFDALVWEVLRFHPINAFSTRVSVAPYTFGAGDKATTVPAGALVLLATRSAMRDPEVVADPETIKLDRPQWQYLHFGSGPHTCLGKYVGMMITPAAIKEVLKLPKLRRADGAAGQVDFKGGAFPESFTVNFG